ncbi:hypothetical protein IG631_13017 [Alternaria alternata]|nr:hypothetical protein IG631_13017 [Alternaria alternata]
MAYVLDCRLDREASSYVVAYDEYFTAEVGHAAWLVCLDDEWIFQTHVFFLHDSILPQSNSGTVFLPRYIWMMTKMFRGEGGGLAPMQTTRRTGNPKQWYQCDISAIKYCVTRVPCNPTKQA